MSNADTFFLLALAGFAGTVISGSAFAARKLYVTAKEAKSQADFKIAKLEMALLQSERIERMNIEEIQQLRAANRSLEKALREKEDGGVKLRHIEFEERG